MVTSTDEKGLTKMNHDVEYDSILGCYCLHYDGEIICLGADTYDDAVEEANDIINDWS